METQTYDNNNSGALFPNDRKEKETHPDLTGSCEVDGKEYWFKGWKKTSKAGKAFLSVAFDPKEAKPDVVSSGVAPMSDDPISFLMLDFDKVWWEKFRHDEVVSILEMTGRKNSDYTGGSENSNPFANFDESLEFGVDPLTGICVRMADKFQRAKAYCNEGKLSVCTEGDQAKDIFRDLIGYSLIALGMIERQDRQP